MRTTGQLTMEESKTIAAGNVREALRHVEAAQNSIDRACQAMCPIIRGRAQWDALSALHTKINERWHALNDWLEKNRDKIDLDGNAKAYEAKRRKPIESDANGDGLHCRCSNPIENCDGVDGSCPIHGRGEPMKSSIFALVFAVLLPALTLSACGGTADEPMARIAIAHFDLRVEGRPLVIPHFDAAVVVGPRHLAGIVGQDLVSCGYKMIGTDSNGLWMGVFVAAHYDLGEETGVIGLDSGPREAVRVVVLDNGQPFTVLAANALTSKEEIAAGREAHAYQRAALFTAGTTMTIGVVGDDRATDRDHVLLVY